MDVPIWSSYLGWQNLIETLLRAHERIHLANLIREKDKPVVLFIVQVRFDCFALLFFLKKIWC